MTDIREILEMLGSHFWLVLAGSLELVIAAILFVQIMAEKHRKAKQVTLLRGNERQFLNEFDKREDEICLVLRENDRMPLYAAGNIEKVLGVTLEELQGDILCLGRKMEDLNRAMRFWRDYLEWDRTGIFQCEVRMKDGEWMQVTAKQDEETGCDFISFRKNTEEREQLEDYEKRVQVAEEASQSKTTFLSRMSHEIRTPMNGIIGMLTLAEGKLDEDAPAMQYIKKTEELSEHLLNLINDILDMSRIEAGKVELEQKVFSLRELGQKLYDMFAKNLEARKIRYEVNFEEMTVDYVIGDEMRISQVIINFLSNAVKFTSEGEILVTFRQMLLRDGQADVMIRVHDTGIGMESDFINRIFRPFEQEGMEISKKYGGTGLGMAITDHLVRLMGGEIVVESTPGQGSDFSVFLHLPVAVKPEEESSVRGGGEEEPESENTFRGRRILMAEDNELNALIAVEILNGMGAEVDVAENGEKAVELFQTHPEHYYDFILMDVQMPVMDGRKAARTIRALKRPDAGDILIFALSADAFLEDERLSLESGMNGHYAKPVDYDALQKNVGRFLREREQN